MIFVIGLMVQGGLEFRVNARSCLRASAPTSDCGAKWGTAGLLYQLTSGRRFVVLVLFVSLISLSGCEVGYRIKPNSVVWVHWNEGTGKVKDRLTAADPSSFEIRGNSYGTDENHVYYKAGLLEGAEPRSFEILSGTYSRDRDSVYFMGYLVPEADAQTIVVVATNYAVDDESVFYRRFKVVGANPENFSIDEFEASAVFSCYMTAEFYGCDERY